MLTIDDLPDDDLLAIFDFCVFRYQYQYLGSFYLDQFDIEGQIESWQSLVHVCRRWRCLVFESARHLNLRLVRKTSVTAKKSLDVWPALPLILLGDVFSVGSLIPKLEHSDRICQIQLSFYATAYLETLWTAMQVPFPGLVALRLSLRGWPGEPALPDSFLGGSAPRLRYLTLILIPFPRLPKLLLSATHLVHLYLHGIPRSGYISPEAMVTCLSVLTCLEELHFHFQSPHPSPDQESRRPLPPTRSVLPALTKFGFKGINGYFEDFVSRIDAPRLYRLSIMLFNDNDTPEPNQFISRTPGFGAYNEARLIFHDDDALVRLQSQPDHGMVEVQIFLGEPVRQFSSLGKICTSSLHLLLTMDNLYFEVKRSTLFSTDAIENTDWLNILLPFTAVKNLYLPGALWPRMGPALQELTGGRTTEVLPALENVLLEGFQPSEPVQEGIEEFISARQLINRPVAISAWDRG